MSMATTPKNKLAGLQRETKKPNAAATTPLNNRRLLELDNEESPVYFPTTQESNEEMDVLWDWNSPQTSRILQNSQRKSRKQKRLMELPSPKMPCKKYISNSFQDLEWLRDELKILQDQLAEPDDESILCLSPQQEMDLIAIENHKEPEPEPHVGDFDVFDDFSDELLLQCTQQLEEKIKEDEAKKNDCQIDEILNKYAKSSPKTNLFEDSFDGSLAIIDIDVDNKAQKATHFQRTYSEGQNAPKTSKQFNRAQSFELEPINCLPKSKLEEIEKNRLEALARRKKKLQPLRTEDKPESSAENHNVIHTISGKLEFHRTKSFEIDAIQQNTNILPKSTLNEIERKRVEALAKLELKKKLGSGGNSMISPNKCSLEEIEKKRLEALAKLEAKRLEELVEKNRQEAIKKLQMSKIKNATTVRSVNTHRLQ